MLVAWTRERQGMLTEFVWGELVKDGHHEDKEGDARITLRWFLGRQIVRTGT
jgi:hypothetical protein